MYASELSRQTGLIPLWKPGAPEGELHLSDTRHILIIEDCVEDSFLLTRQLARADLDDCVTVIGNGHDALEWLMAASKPPLAIFLDLNLPGMSGIDLIRSLKADPSLASVPVIVMTGSLNPHDVETCTALGISAYLPKPISLTTFIKIVSPLLPKKV